MLYSVCCSTLYRSTHFYLIHTVQYIKVQSVQSVHSVQCVQCVQCRLGPGPLRAAIFEGLAPFMDSQLTTGEIWGILAGLNSISDWDQLRQAHG